MSTTLLRATTLCLTGARVAPAGTRSSAPQVGQAIPFGLHDDRHLDGAAHGQEHDAQEGDAKVGAGAVWRVAEVAEEGAHDQSHDYDLHHSEVGERLVPQEQLPLPPGQQLDHGPARQGVVTVGQRLCMAFVSAQRHHVRHSLPDQSCLHTEVCRALLPAYQFPVRHSPPHLSADVTINVIVIIIITITVTATIIVTSPSHLWDLDQTDLSGCMHRSHYEIWKYCQSTSRMQA